MHTSTLLVAATALLATVAQAEEDRPKYYFPRQVKRAYGNSTPPGEKQRRADDAEPSFSPKSLPFGRSYPETPHGMMAEVLGELRPGGAVVVGTGDISSLLRLQPTTSSTWSAPSLRPSVSSAPSKSPSSLGVPGVTTILVSDTTVVPFDSKTTPPSVPVPTASHSTGVVSSAGTTRPSSSSSVPAVSKSAGSTGSHPAVSGSPSDSKPSSTAPKVVPASTGSHSAASGSSSAPKAPSSVPKVESPLTGARTSASKASSSPAAKVGLGSTGGTVPPGVVHTTSSSTHSVPKSSAHPPSESKSSTGITFGPGGVVTSASKGSVKLSVKTSPSSPAPVRGKETTSGLVGRPTGTIPSVSKLPTSNLDHPIGTGTHSTAKASSHSTPKAPSKSLSAGSSSPGTGKTSPKGTNPAPSKSTHTGGVLPVLTLPSILPTGSGHGIIPVLSSVVGPIISDVKSVLPSVVIPTGIIPSIGTSPIGTGTAPAVKHTTEPASHSPTIKLPGTDKSKSPFPTLSIPPISIPSIQSKSPFPTLSIPSISIPSLPISIPVGTGTGGLPTGTGGLTLPTISSKAQVTSSAPAPTGTVGSDPVTSANSTAPAPPIIQTTSAHSSNGTVPTTPLSPAPATQSKSKPSHTVRTSSASVTAAPTSPKAPETVLPVSTDTKTALWLPTTLIAASSSSLASGQSGTPTASGIPSGAPMVISNPNPTTVPSAGTTKIQIGFTYALNYPWVMSQLDASNQIFNYLPAGLAFGLGLQQGQVIVTTLSPLDTTATLDFVTTVAMVHIPSSLVDKLKMDLHIPVAQLYKNPDSTIAQLMGYINPAIPLTPGTNIAGSAPGSSGSPTPNSGAGNGLFNPQSQSQSSSVKGTTAGIAMAAVAGSALYGAAMFLVARRYKRRKQNHRRSSSITNPSEMMQSGSPALMGGANENTFMSGGRQTPMGTTHDRSSKGSGRSSARTQQISAPMMAENSLGWN